MGERKIRSEIPLVDRVLEKMSEENHADEALEKTKEDLESLWDFDYMNEFLKVLNMDVHNELSGCQPSNQKVDEKEEKFNINAVNSEISESGSTAEPRIKVENTGETSEKIDLVFQQ